MTDIALQFVSAWDYRQFMRVIGRRLFSVGLVLALLLGMNPSVASAASWIQYQSSPVDTYNRSDLPAAYDITQVDFGVSDSDPTRYAFFLDFAKPISANLFSDGLRSWAGIFLDINGDGKDDYSFETDVNTPYSSNYYHAGVFTDRTSGSPVISSFCDVRTWSSLDTQASWIGFSIPKTCLPFGTNISIQGYSDHNGNDSTEFDFAPTAYWTLNLSGGAVSSTPGDSSSSNSVADLPTVSAAGAANISGPSNPPDNLVNLAATVTQSVVTVLCGNSLGSGWAINAQLSSSLTNAGYKTYLITNHHVIADCTTARNITVILADQTRVPAYVWSWDQANDVAGITTTTYIPPLNWRGATPQQGWWAGIIGSPLGFPGILTTGIVSSNNASTFLGTTTAPINHGNSGGPVFDRTGRVIGLATAKYNDSEGFGIFNGTPLLCGKIINCASTNQVWSGTTVQPTVNSCQSAPNAPNLLISYPGPIFTVTLSGTGGAATTIKWQVTYYNTSTQLWEGWSTLKEEVFSGGTYKFEVPISKSSDPNVSRVGFSVIATNACGDSVAARENVVGDGVDIRLKPDFVASYANNVSFPYSQGRVGLSTLVVSSEFLPISITDISEAVCTYSSSGSGEWIFFLKPGTCSFTASTNGNTTVSASSPVQISFEITKPVTKPVTIICVKGKLSKKVTAAKPICPSGYKKK